MLLFGRRVLDVDGLATSFIVPFQGLSDFVRETLLR
jgi:hypothetical protein